ncbi:5538_t:CDS:1, partial [Cetraspora pellucida]
MTQNNDIVTPLNTPLLTIIDKYKCDICQKTFKNNAELSHHNTIIRKYSIQEKLQIVPKNLSEAFKNDLIYFIHCQLPNGFKNAGKKTVSVACSKN